MREQLTSSLFYYLLLFITLFIHADPRQPQLISSEGVCERKNKIYLENMNNYLQSMKNVKLLKVVTSKGEC